MSPFYAYVQTDGFMTDWHTDQLEGQIERLRVTVQRRRGFVLMGVYL